MGVASSNMAALKITMLSVGDFLTISPCEQIPDGIFHHIEY
jgi:hypothetical protein